MSNPQTGFVIYVDRQLLAAPRLLQIRTHCHLPPQRTIARADPHYRSTRSIGPYSTDPPPMPDDQATGTTTKSPNLAIMPLVTV
jgi:hypothetical protein